MARPIREVFEALARVLDGRRVRWYVFGAQAVLAHGHPRLTADIDITVEPGERSNDELLAMFAEGEIVPRAEGFDAFMRTSRLLPLHHAPTQIPVDVVLGSSAIERAFFARAVRLDLGGAVVPILAVEDLIALKAAAGRRKDQEDILGILEQQWARIDRARLAAVLAALDEALEEPRATERFERLRRRFERRKRR